MSNASVLPVGYTLASEPTEKELIGQWLMIILTSMVLGLVGGTAWLVIWAMTIKNKYCEVNQ